LHHRNALQGLRRRLIASGGEWRPQSTGQLTLIVATAPEVMLCRRFVSLGRLRYLESAATSVLVWPWFIVRACVRACKGCSHANRGHRVYTAPPLSRTRAPKPRAPPVTATTCPPFSRRYGEVGGLTRAAMEVQPATAPSVEFTVPVTAWPVPPPASAPPPVLTAPILRYMQVLCVCSGGSVCAVQRLSRCCCFLPPNSGSHTPPHPTHLEHSVVARMLPQARLGEQQAARHRLAWWWAVAVCVVGQWRSRRACHVIGVPLGPLPLLLLTAMWTTRSALARWG
jgi:hypothetical protein